MASIRSPGRPSRPGHRGTQQTTLKHPVLFIHDTSNRSTQVYNEDVLLSPEIFVELKIQTGDVIDLEQEGKHVAVQVRSVDSKPLADGSKSLVGSQISVSKALAALLGFQSMKEVTASRIDSIEPIVLETVEVVIKGQYLGRSDMWRLKKHLTGTSVYSGKSISFSGMQIQAYELWTKSESILCGVIKQSTKVVFRSRSAMYYILIQMSSEMWSEDISSEAQSQSVTKFIRSLFSTWESNRCNHDISIVLFGRMKFYGSTTETFESDGGGQAFEDEDGTLYQDFYKVVVESSRKSNFTQLLLALKRAIAEFPALVRASLPPGSRCLQRAKLSDAATGNVLEAMNLALNALGRHYIDRSFTRTGLQLVVVTSGCGAFEVTSSLLDLTRRRIIDDGIGCDLITLSEPALHITPVFKYRSTKDPKSNEHDYEIPTWIHQLRFDKNGGLHEGIRVSELDARNLIDSLKPSSLIKSKLTGTSKTASNLSAVPLFVLSDQWTDPDWDLWTCQKQNRGPYFGKQPHGRTLEYRPSSLNTKLRSESTDPDNISTRRPLISRSYSSGRIPSDVKEVSSSSSPPSPSRSRGLSVPSENVHETCTVQPTPYGSLPHTESEGVNVSGKDNSVPHKPLPFSQIRSPPPGSFASSFGNNHREGASSSSSHGKSHPISIRQGGKSRYTDNIFDVASNRSWRSTGGSGSGGSFGSASHRDSNTISRSGLAQSLERASLRSRQPIWGNELSARQSARRADSYNSRRQITSNPFVLYKDLSSVVGEMEMRWAYAFPQARRSSKDVFGNTWKSLCVPASLPLTCGKRPTEASLNQTHSPSGYDVDLGGVNDAEAQNKLFEKILDHRLSQCFQFCVDPSGNPDAVAPSRAAQLFSSSRWAPVKAQPLEDSCVTRWMSFGNTFHRLSLSAKQKSIKVTMFRTSEDEIIHEKRTSTYKLCPQFESHWKETTSVLQTASLRLYRWSMHDNEMSEGDLTSSDNATMLRFWRVQFALLPASIGNPPTANASQFELLIRDMNRIIEMREQQKRKSKSPITTEPPAHPDSRATSPQSSATAFSIESPKLSKDDEQFSHKLVRVSSKELTLEIASKEDGDRDEMLVVKYDDKYIPQQAFHFEVQWLEATACLVNELVERWSKRAETRGFRLARIPIVLPVNSVDSSETPNPFRDDVKIPLAMVALPGESIDSISAPSRVQLALLTRFQYVFDCELAGPRLAHRFIHLSGESMITVQEPTSFGWCRNVGYDLPKRNSMSISANADRNTLSTDERLAELKRLCSSPQEMFAFFYPSEDQTHTHRRNRSSGSVSISNPFTSHMVSDPNPGVVQGAASTKKLGHRRARSELINFNSDISGASSMFSHSTDQQEGARPFSQISRQQSTESAKSGK